MSEPSRAVALEQAVRLVSAALGNPTALLSEGGDVAGIDVVAAAGMCMDIARMFHRWLEEDL